MLSLHGSVPDRAGSCVVHALGCAAAACCFDAQLEAADVDVRYLEHRRTDGGLDVSVWNQAVAPASTGVDLRLGHQQYAPDSLAGCPAVVDEDGQPTPRLAAVMVVVDERRRVLLTRRPREMRTFPGAWVMPGGSVDPSDQSTTAAALRELLEETGLRVPLTAARPLCLWESCYPPDAAAWRARRAAGERCSHHLIVYHTCAVAVAPLLQLSGPECDCACWVPLDDLATLEPSMASYARAEGAPQGEPVPAASLRGIYPNELGEGIGRAHRFALRRLAAALPGV